MKKISIKISMFFLTMLFSYSLNAQNFNLESMKAKDVIKMSEDNTRGILDFIKPEKEEPLKTKEWTVMVFMNAKNNLSDSSLGGLVGKWAEKDISEMKKVGSNEKMNIVVEYGEKGKGSKRILILKKNNILNSGEKLYSQDPKSDMGDYKRLIDFINFSKKNFPARKYMLIVWNHGLGWIDPVLEVNNAGTGTSRGISFDDDTKNYIRTKQLGEVLRQTGYVDVLGMNACLMQMTEVLYEMKGYAGLIIGSEETMLAQGFDYEKLLNFMNSNTNFNKEQISNFFINWYKQFYQEGMQVGPINMPLNNIASTLSVIEGNKLNQLPQYLNYFSNIVMKNNETNAIKKAIPEVIRFTSIADPEKDKKKMIAPYVDLYDFARIIGENAQNDETRKASQMLMNFIKNEVVVKSVGINKDTENNYDYSKVGGLSINMTMKINPVPEQIASIYETKYQDLSLSKDSNWDEFVNYCDSIWTK